MALTQTELNNCFERCYILKNFNIHRITNRTIVNIKNFFTKVRSLEKISSIMEPIEIEYDRTKDTIVFSWMNIDEDTQKVDMLDLHFSEKDYLELQADYGTLDINIKDNIPYDDEFHEKVIVHLRHFKNKKRKKRYK